MGILFPSWPDQHIKSKEESHSWNNNYGWQFFMLVCKVLSVWDSVVLYAPKEPESIVVTDVYGHRLICAASFNYSIFCVNAHLELLICFTVYQQPPTPAHLSKSGVHYCLRLFQASTGKDWWCTLVLGQVRYLSHMCAEHPSIWRQINRLDFQAEKKSWFSHFGIFLKLAAGPLSVVLSGHMKPRLLRYQCSVQRYRSKMIGSSERRENWIVTIILETSRRYTHCRVESSVLTQTRVVCQADWKEFGHFHTNCGLSLQKSYILFRGAEGLSQNRWWIKQRASSLDAFSPFSAFLIKFDHVPPCTCSH